MKSKLKNHCKQLFSRLLFLFIALMFTAIGCQRNNQANSIYQLDYPVFKKTIAQASMSDAQATLKLPLSDGQWASFLLSEYDIMEPGLAQKMPGIHAYHGYSHDGLSVQLITMPDRMHAYVHGLGKDTAINGTIADQIMQMHVEKGQLGGPDRKLFCGTQNPKADALHRELCTLRETQGPAMPASFGDKVRVYLFAAAVESTLTSQIGDVTEVFKQLLFMLTDINAFYEPEAAIRFRFATRELDLVFMDPATDPFAAARSINDFFNIQQSTLDSVIGKSDYDLGHLLIGYDNPVFSAMGYGGVAYQTCEVCDDDNKAKGISIGVNNSKNKLSSQTLLHEIGHQLGAEHTFNSNEGDLCKVVRIASSAVEPSGGLSIMGYSMCDSDAVYQGVDEFAQRQPYFHSHSQEQVYACTRIKHACGVDDAKGGNQVPAARAPIVGAPGRLYNLNIPTQTPFELTGEGTDADGDSLTYAWEQMDLGDAAPPNTDNGNRPIFRWRAPSDKRTRTFPALGKVMRKQLHIKDDKGNIYYAGEEYPTTNRTLNFRFTVRDGRGGVANTDVVLKSVIMPGASSSFDVVKPALAETWQAVTSGIGGTFGLPLDVRWNVADTDKAPISASTVTISFLWEQPNPTDPYDPDVAEIVLATHVANTGSATIVPSGKLLDALATHPNMVGAIKIKAEDHVFFNTSARIFVTNGAAPTPPSITSLMSKVIDGKTVHFVTQAGTEPSRLTKNVDYIATVDDIYTPYASLRASAVVPMGLNFSSFRLEQPLSGPKSPYHSLLTFRELTTRCDATPGVNHLYYSISDGFDLTANADLVILITPNTAPTPAQYSPLTLTNGSKTDAIPIINALDNGSFTVKAFVQGDSRPLTVTDQGTITVSAFPELLPGGYKVQVDYQDNCLAASSTTFPLTITK